MRFEISGKLVIAANHPDDIDALAARYFALRDLKGQEIEQEAQMTEEEGGTIILRCPVCTNDWEGDLPEDPSVRGTELHIWVDGAWLMDKKE